MPVRSSSSHVLSWPSRESVDAAARTWGAALKEGRPDVLKVGYFGSYSRGDWGVGSDLDVVVIVTESSTPPLRRGLEFDTLSGLPVPVDLLVYTVAEWDRLQAEQAPFARRLSAEVTWVA